MQVTSESFIGKNALKPPNREKAVPTVRIEGLRLLVDNTMSFLDSVNSLYDKNIAKTSLSPKQETVSKSVCIRLH
jgi:hypothetical protein